MGKTRIVFLLLLSVALMFVAGCTETIPKSTEEPQRPTVEKQDEKAPATSKKIQEEAKTFEVVLYYPTADGENMAPFKTKITAKHDDKYQKTVDALLTTTPPKGLLTVIPHSVRVNSVTVSDGIATLDLSANLVKNFTGGSTGEEMLVASFVNTLTEFSEIKRVKILVDGKSVETIAGHMDLTEPLPRMGNLIRKGQ